MTSCKNAGQATNGLMMTVMMVMAGGVRESDAGAKLRVRDGRDANDGKVDEPRGRSRSNDGDRK